MPKNRTYRAAADKLLKADKADEFKLKDFELKKQRKKNKVEDNYEKKVGRKIDTGRVPHKLENVCALMARTVCPGN